FHHLNVRGAAGCRFKAERARSGEQVQYTLVAELSGPEMVQPVEQSFTYPVGSWPHAFPFDHGDGGTAVFTAYNTNIVLLHAPLNASSTEFRSLSVKRMFSFFRRKKPENKPAEVPAQQAEQLATEETQPSADTLKPAEPVIADPAPQVET